MIQTKYSSYTDEEIIKITYVSDNPLIQELSKRLADTIDSISYLNNIEEFQEDVRCLYKHNNNLTEKVDYLSEQIDDLHELVDILNKQIDELKPRRIK